MSDRPDVLLLILDSVRKDRVSHYGHSRETTPVLDQLAARATVYENAYAPAPWTLPSHCSMLTGLFPSEHGVTNGFSDSTGVLPTDVETITEHLKQRGYLTGGFSNNPWVGQLSGLDRGFDTFVEWDLERSRSAPEDGATTRDALYSRLHRLLGQLGRQPVYLLKRRFFTRTLVRQAIRWFDRTAARSSPTATFLNLMEAHSPYFPPKSAFRALHLDPPGPVEPRLLNTKLLAYVMGKRELAPDDQSRVHEYYDASLRYQDRKVGELFDAMRESGTFEETLIVVCSDHGKTLGEYDRSEVPPHYTRTINTNVPLIVKYPGQRQSRRIDQPFELIDLFEMIERTVEGKVQPEAAQSERSAAMVEDFVPHTGRNEPDSIQRWRVLADRDYKYVRDDGDRDFLFDISDSRDELIESPDSERLGSYRSALDQRVSSLSVRDGSGSEESNELAEAVQSQLSNLGYMEDS